MPNHDMGGAIAPAVLEPVEEATVGHPGEPLGGNRGPRNMATKPLEAPAVAGGDGDVRVEAHPARAGATLAVELRHHVGIDAIAHANHRLAGASSRRDAARHRGPVELRQQRLLLRERVGVEGIHLGTQAAALSQARGTRRHLPHDARALVARARSGFSGRALDSTAKRMTRASQRMKK